MRRWKISTRTISGTVTMTEAAMIRPQGSSRFQEREYQLRVS